MQKHNKGFISEQDVSTLLQKYTANTILALLQEVAQCEGVKIDWHALVKNTSTGISNPREYQMLWRHLAYRHTLLETVQDGAQPMDDDSDFEFELEAFPSVTSDAAMEAAACVRVLIASGVPSDSSNPNNSTVEAPLTINIPNGQSFGGTSENADSSAMQGVNITVPVSVQKQPLPGEGLDGVASAGSFPPRRKRKPWSQEEDTQLIAAVKKSGEGNWANILRNDFKGDRTASQLSQRWAIIRKRWKGNPVVNTSGSQLSEAQRAARHAMNLALDPPAKNITTPSPSGTSLNNMSINHGPSTTTAETLPLQHQSQQRPVMTKSSSLAPFGSTVKSQVTLSKTSSLSSLNSDPVRAAAVAAGARIATQSDAASLLKAAQAKNAVHIMPAGGSAKKSPIPGVVSSHLEGHPNVHFISTGLATAPLSSRQTVASSGLGTSLVNPLSRTQNKPSTSTPPPKPSTEQAGAELPTKQDAKPAGVIAVSGLGDLAKEKVQEEATSVAGNEPEKQVQQDKVTMPNQEAEPKSQGAAIESSKTLPKVMTCSEPVGGIDNQAESKQNANDSKTMDLPVKEEKDSFIIQTDGKENTNGAKILCPGVKDGENQSAGQAEVKQTAIATATKAVGENPPALQAEAKEIAKIIDSHVKEENQFELQAEGKEMRNAINTMSSPIKEVEIQSAVQVSGDAL